MQKIVPNLWFAGDAEEGGEFYARAFEDARSEVISRYPTEGLVDFQREMAGAALTVDVVIAGFRLTLINAGPEFRPDSGVSFMVTFDPSTDADARAHLGETWARLADGGTVKLDLGEYPFSPYYGWIEDRFGVNWQLILGDPDRPAGAAVMPALLFGGASQNQARAAVEQYTTLFADARVDMVSEYPSDTGPAPAGAVQFCSFTLEGQWFVAMDSGVEQRQSFTPGVSLAIACADQAEIDRLWAALSRVPDAEQCGWCVDEFGLSWQIVPAAMGELITSPGAYRALMDMKKISIADLQAAAG